MRKLLYVLVGVVVVAVAGVLILPSLVDLRALVQPVLQSVKDSTGREVRIGAIGISHVQVRFAARSADELCEQVTRFGEEIGPHLTRIALS